MTTAPIYHTWVILSNHDPSTVCNENPGKLLILSSAPPLLSPFWSFLVLQPLIGTTRSAGVGGSGLALAILVKKTTENECFAVWRRW